MLPLILNKLYSNSEASPSAAPAVAMTVKKKRTKTYIFKQIKERNKPIKEKKEEKKTKDKCLTNKRSNNEKSILFLFTNPSFIMLNSDNQIRGILNVYSIKNDGQDRLPFVI